MIVNFTEKEINVLKYYMGKAKIDAEGGNAIGITSKDTVDSVNSIIKKINSSSTNQRRYA